MERTTEPSKWLNQLWSWGKIRLDVSGYLNCISVLLNENAAKVVFDLQKSRGSFREPERGRREVIPDPATVQVADVLLKMLSWMGLMFPVASHLL